jgi:poly(A) polymerase
VLDRLGPGQRAVTARLADAFDAAGAELYLVGGMVRDLLLERPIPNDLDFATSVPPERTKAILAALSHAGLYDVGERFGTIGVVMPEGDEAYDVEITTYRSEEYEPGSRHPAVEYGDSIEDDLSRRDITVNAIAVDVRSGRSGQIVDPFYGQADLHMGLLRAVGDPDERFAEDPLRLRASPASSPSSASPSRRRPLPRWAGRRNRCAPSAPSGSSPS